MAALHIVDQIDSLRRLKDSSIAHEWESGRCAVAADAAEKLIGADLYIHEGPARSSFFGGKITGFRTPEGDESGSEMIFRFQASNEHRNIKTARTGWSKDKKIIW